MPVTCTVRNVLAFAIGGLAVAAGIVAAPAPPVLAQQQCVPAGASTAPTPWPQKLLAPERVWPLTTGAGQRVAVVSTGVGDNPQLAGRVVAQVNLAPADQGGEPNGTSDCIGFGTGVAGIIGAQRSEGIGFHGAAPDAELLSAKVVGDQASAGGRSQATEPDVLAAAINWAVENGATVIAVAAPAYEDSEPLRRAVERAQRDDVVIVAATGEVTEQDPASLRPYPAAYDGVLGVSAIGQDSAVTPNSRAGDVDLVAPGHEILTTYPGGGVGPASGSAFATGYVAGAVALTRGYHPEISAEETVRRMLATAAPAPEGTGSRSYGHGIVNPYQAVVENVVAGDPAQLPPLTKAPVDQAAQERAEAERRSDSIALALAGGGTALVLIMVGTVVFGPRAWRRRWRSGFAEVPADRPEDDLPEPPAELFGDRPARRD